MHSPKKLTYRYVVFALGVLAVTGTLNLVAFGEPTVQISPTCGPADPGFNIVINANGFTPEGNVDVKIVDSNDKIPLFTYFETNSTGGFNEVTYADDLKEDNYKMYFADDLDNDGNFDVGATKVFVNVTIPCGN